MLLVIRSTIGVEPTRVEINTQASACLILFNLLNNIYVPVNIHLLDNIRPILGAKGPCAIRRGLDF